MQQPTPEQGSKQSLCRPSTSANKWRRESTELHLPGYRDTCAKRTPRVSPKQGTVSEGFYETDEAVRGPGEVKCERKKRLTL